MPEQDNWEPKTKLGRMVKNGEIKGTRAFSGEFYIILNELLEKIREKILKEIKTVKKIDIQKLSEKTKFTKTLIKITMEFLKEEGKIIEKKKNEYKYIE